MKIAIYGSDPKKIGGIETFCRNLNTALDKHEIIFFCGKANNKKKDLFEMKNVKHLAKNKLHEIIIRLFFKERVLIKNTKAFSPDYIILNSPKNLAQFKNISAKIILVQHRTCTSWMVAKRYFNNDKRQIDLVNSMVDKIVALSKYESPIIKESLNFKKEIVAIRHCTNIETRTTPKEKNKDLIMLTRFENSLKRIDLAINSMKKLPDFTLHLYGKGPDLGMLKNLAKDLNNVVFHPMTNKITETLDMYSTYIMTSDLEGYPLTNIEALKRGLPVIVRDTFLSAKDIIDKENGILLDATWDEDKFVDAVNTIYNNYEFYSTNAIEKSKDYNTEVFKKQWEDLIV